MTSAFDLLSQGKLFPAFKQVFIDLGIEESMFYLMFAMFGYTMIYLKTRSPGMVALTIVLTGPIIFASAFASSLLAKYLFGVVAIAITMLIYSSYTDKNAG